ncbi:MAG: tyrosine-protein kinase family protein [Planctomycetota bacterium]
MTGMALECEACGYLEPVEDLAHLTVSCPECEGTLVLVADEVGLEAGESEQGSSGESAWVRPDLPPLPSWDGSDTQRVQGLARAQPAMEMAAPVDLGAELSDQAATGALEVETVHVERGTSGRASRTYDSEDLSRRLGGDEETRNWRELDEGGGDSPGDSSTRSWAELEQGPETRAWNELSAPPTAPMQVIPERPAAPERDAAWHEDLASGGADTGGWEGRLFPVDHDWEALLEEHLPESAEDDPDAKRRIIHLPTSAAPSGDTLDAAQVDAILRPFGIRAPLGSRTQDEDTAGWKDVEHDDLGFALQDDAPPLLLTVDSLRPEQVDPALVAARDPDGLEAAPYRDLLARLGARPRQLLITSAARREGRTTLALNLALAITRRARGQAIVVEADLDGGGVLASLGVGSTEDGLLGTLRRRDDPRATLVRVHLGDLHVVPRGQGAGRDLLATDMGDYLRALRGAFPEAWILIDGPPVHEGGAELLPATEGALLVVRRARASRDTVARAIEAVGRADLLGAVFNAG